MKVGDRVVVVQDTYGDRNGWGKIGKSGQVVRYGPCHDTHSLTWDVKLDEPLPDGREFLWFSTRELQVL
jgi:hypothetical protein